MPRQTTKKPPKSTKPRKSDASAPRKQSVSANDLDRRWRTSPFVLRVTRWAGYPEPVLVVSERKSGEEEKDDEKKPNSKLHERGVIYGDSLRRCLSVIKRVLGAVCDESGIPLNLQRVVSKDGFTVRGNLPLDEEAGAKLSLLFKLQERIKDLDRVELISLRIEKFTREEAFYWLSRITHFGPAANQWAICGMRVMLAGDSGDENVAPMLEKLRLRA